MAREASLHPISEKQICERLDHGVYNLNPKHRGLNQHPTVSDVLPIKLLSGTVAIRGTIKHFTKKGVVFEGEQRRLSSSSVYNKVRLYKFIHPPDSPHPTLVILALVQTLGPGFPFAEMQDRWVARIMSGKFNLLSKEFMNAEINKKLELMRR
ncbi:UNVERIFIED_CONTAM: Fmo5 [Trichonephila clavipes]